MGEGFCQMYCGKGYVKLNKMNNCHRKGQIYNTVLSVTSRGYNGVEKFYLFCN